MLVATAQLAANRHTKCSGKRRPGVARAVAIVLALRPQKKTIETAELPHRMETVEPPCKHFVDITLVTDIHHEAVTGRVEHAMQGNRQFHNTEVWPEVTAGLGEDFDQLIAQFLCKLRQVLFTQRFAVSRRADPIEQTPGRDCRGGLMIFRRV